MPGARPRVAVRGELQATAMRCVAERVDDLL